MDPSEVEQTLRYIKKTEKDEDYIRTIKVPAMLHARVFCGRFAHLSQFRWVETLMLFLFCLGTMTEYWSCEVVTKLWCG